MQQWQFIDNFNQLDMFRMIVRPSSGALDCVYSLWYKAPTLLQFGNMEEVDHTPNQFHLFHVAKLQQRRCFILQAVNTL